MLNLSEKTDTQQSEPWGQRPGESDLFYAAFLVFLSLPQPRSIKQLAGRVDYSHSYLVKMQASYDWRERASAYDAHLATRKIMRREDLILGLQNAVVKEIVDDTGLLLAKWRELVVSVDDPKDFQRLTAARVAIDGLRRRAAELPGNYLPVVTTTPKPDDDEIWELELPDGNPHASKAAASSQTSTTDFGESDEVQSVELWSAVGEEFSSEE